MTTDPNNYFVQLGRNVAAAMANPHQRSRLEAIMRTGLDAHISGPMARDQMPPRGGTASRNYDQDPNDPNGGGEEASEVDQCIQTVKGWVERVPPDQQGELISRLAEIIQAAHGMGAGDQGLLPNNMGAVDRRSGNRAGRAAMDAAFAVRSANSQSFQRRFPFVNVTLNGAGSR